MPTKTSTRTTYTWTAEETTENSGNALICSKCGSTNSDDSLFCKKCGSPLNAGSTQRPNINNNEQYNSNGMPYGGNMPTGGGGMPMGGMPFVQNTFTFDKEEDFGDNIKADDIATYVKVNVPFYVSLFQRIKNYGKSRFSFCAFIFTGGWFLYRKQYLKGAIIGGLFAAFMIISGLFEGSRVNILNDATSYLGLQTISSNTDMQNVMNYVSTLSTEKQLYFYLPVVSELAKIILMFVCGFTANRSYYNHCKKKIIKIKADSKNQEETKTALETKGGVDFKIAVCMLVCYVILSYFPLLL